MKLASLSLLLLACGAPAPAAPSDSTPAAATVPSAAARDAGGADAPVTTEPRTVAAAAPTADPCPRPAAPVVLVSDVAVASLAKAGAVDGDANVAPKQAFRGSVYQRATLAVGQHQALRVPANALVAEGAKAGTIEVYVAKTLGFAGHPPETMSVESVRRNLGLATTDDGTTFVIASYGEFDTRIEGAATMRLFVRVPKAFPVHVGDGLAGDDSEPARWPTDEASQRGGDAGRVGYWYAPVNPRRGWSRVKLVDDAQRVASHAGTYPKLAPPCAR